MTTPLQRFSVETGKAQPVRLMDVFVLGPLMIYVGLQKDAPAIARQLLVVAGVGTILYNWQNYITLERAKESGQTILGP